MHWRIFSLNATHAISKVCTRGAWEVSTRRGTSGLQIILTIILKKVNFTESTTSFRADFTEHTKL